MKSLLLTNIFLFLSIAGLYAQTPIIVDPKTDTVYVQGSDIVQNKEIVVKEEKTVKFYLNGYGNVFNNYSVYDPCPECVEFLNTYKASVTPQTSYGVGLSLLYANSNWVLEAALDYALIKEKFDFKNSLGTVYHSDNMMSYA